MPTENVTVANCRLSSASSALKFCDGNRNAVRRVLVDNVVITNSNRGLAFMVFDGGIVEDAVISNVTIETHRFDWFWWGDGDPIHFNIKRRSEVDGTRRDNEPHAGVIRNVTLSNIIAHGAGTSAIEGHPDSPLEGIRFEGVRLFVARDPKEPYEHTQDAMTLKYARDVVMRGVEVGWEEPRSTKWASALRAENVDGVRLDRVTLAAAPGSSAAVLDLRDATNFELRDSDVKTVHVSGRTSRSVRIKSSAVKTTTGPEVAGDAIVLERE